MAEGVPTRLAALCRMILVFRLATLLVTVLGLFDQPSRLGLLLLALAVALVASYLPLRRWERLAPTLEAHPALLGLDVLVAEGILLATGVDGPFFLYTLSTALLAGVVYRRTGATVFAGILLAAYYAIVVARSPALEANFQTMVGDPVLYPFAAAGGAAVRRLLDREARAGRLLAAEGERLRVAREMHDSLGKTLYGLSLSASGVAAQAHRDPVRAAEQARALAEASRVAAEEARTLISGLRADQLSLPLGAAIGQYVREWGGGCGIAADVRADPAADASADERYELFCILREALENVERHAGARRVSVELAARDGLELIVADDGDGVASLHVEAIEPAGHFGLLGMRERAERVGGRLTLAHTPGGGTTVRATVPRAAGADLVGTSAA